MTSNGVSGGNSKANVQWKVGLMNSCGKYLTAESFGFKINVSGTSLKKKQIFFLEQDVNEEVVYIRSNLGRYISADKYGKVTCDSEERGQTEKFAVEYDKSGSGKWAFKNIAHGNFLGGSDDNFKCFSKSVTATELWVVNLAIHPQVHIQNVNRKRYASLRNEELQVTDVIPLGPEAVIILHFDNGKYALKTYDNRYLSRDGTLSTELSDDCRFGMEIRGGSNGGFAFKDCTGTYLTALGAPATMKARNKTVSKDELFSLENSFPQVVLTSLSNSKKVSVRQGVDVSANQDAEEDTSNEIFQMELVVPETENSPSKWAFRTASNTYWTQEGHGGIQATARDASKPSSQFVINWLDDGTISLKASNDHYIQSRLTGQLVGVSSSVTSKEKFYVRIVNRPLLILKNDNGFVGLKSPYIPEVHCSKTNYEVIFVEPSNDGHYFLKGTNNKYWRLSDNASIVADGESPQPFLLELRSSSVLTIKAPNGSYIRGELKGNFHATAQAVDSSTLWEY